MKRLHIWMAAGYWLMILLSMTSFFYDVATIGLEATIERVICPRKGCE